MDNVDFVIGLARVQDELVILYVYLEHNSVINEREDYKLLALFVLHMM